MKILNFSSSELNMKQVLLLQSSNTYKLRHGISNNVICALNKDSDQPAQYAQSDQSLCFSLEYSVTVKLLTDHHKDF